MTYWEEGKEAGKSVSQPPRLQNRNARARAQAKRKVKQEKETETSQSHQKERKKERNSETGKDRGPVRKMPKIKTGNGPPARDSQSMRTRSKQSSRTCNRTPGTWPKSVVRSKKEAEKVESIEGTTVLLGGFVFCLGFRVLVYLLFLEQKCSLKNTRASISRFSSDELSISTFFPPYSKAWKIRPAPLEFCGTFKRKLQPGASLVVQSANKSSKSLKCKFWTEKAGFRRARPWKIGFDFPNPREETHNVRHNVRKRGGKKAKQSDVPFQPLMTQSLKDLMPLKKCAGVNERERERALEWVRRREGERRRERERERERERRRKRETERQRGKGDLL